MHTDNPAGGYWFWCDFCNKELLHHGPYLIIYDQDGFKVREYHEHCYLKVTAGEHYA